MSYDLILDRLLALEAWRNDLIANDKNNDEFTQMTTLDVESKLRVFLSGTSYWIKIEQIILASQEYGSVVENYYDSDHPTGNDIATMISAVEQANQTYRRIQFVEDASADPDITSGYAYYEKLDSSTETLADDYRRLSAEEVAAIQILDAFNDLTVKEKSTSSLEDTGALRSMSIYHTGSNLHQIVFDPRMSRFLAGYKAEIGSRSYTLVIFNKTQDKTIIADFSDLEYTTAVGPNANTFYRIALPTNTLADDFAVLDNCLISIEITGAATEKRILVGGRPYFVDTTGNTDVNAIEVGNTFRGWPADERYVEGRCIALPFDVDDDTKCKLVTDNEYE